MADNAYVNKVVVDGTTLIDLTSDTVTSETLLSGVTAHKKNGSTITGSVSIVHYYTGSSAPSSSLGEDGDIYLMG